MASKRSKQAAKANAKGMFSSMSPNQYEIRLTGDALNPVNFILPSIEDITSYESVEKGFKDVITKVTTTQVKNPMVKLFNKTTGFESKTVRFSTDRKVLATSFKRMVIESAFDDDAIDAKTKCRYVAQIYNKQTGLTQVGNVKLDVDKADVAEAAKQFKKAKSFVAKIAKVTVDASPLGQLNRSLEAKLQGMLEAPKQSQQQLAQKVAAKKVQKKVSPLVIQVEAKETTI
jgi:hypothetical protein